MEPADIDWKNIESKYVRDNVYEHINAPKWIDLAAPDALPVDDEVWFCRPDCRHPKTAEDYQRWTPSPKVKHLRSSPEILPLVEGNGNRRQANNLKRRGIAAFLPSSPLREPLKPKAAAPKKFRDDLENQDPSLSTSRPFGAPRGTKTVKEMIKSRAEKKVEEEREEWRQQQKSQPWLRSTLSARNLFSGKNILSQISEFCQELKKLAVRSQRPAAQEEAKGEVVKKDPEAAPEELKRREQGKRDLDSNSKKDDGLVKTGGKMAIKIEGAEEKYEGFDENASTVMEVQACPPTPQRIPSPSSRRLRNPKATATTSCPLNKPSRSTAPRGILQELEEVREEKRELASKDEDKNKASVVSDTERSSMDMFWFLKPCT